MDCVLAQKAEGSQKSGSSTVGTVGETPRFGNRTDWSDRWQKSDISDRNWQSENQETDKTIRDCRGRSRKIGWNAVRSARGNPEENCWKWLKIAKKTLLKIAINFQKTVPELPGGPAAKKSLRLRIPKSAAHDEGAQFTWIPPTNQRLRNMLKKRVTLEESMQFRV